MSGHLSTKHRRVAAAFVLVLSAAALEGRPDSTSERPPGSGTRTCANARVVAVDIAARTLTVRGCGMGKDETFTVEPRAMAGARVLKPGDKMSLGLRALGAGDEKGIEVRLLRCHVAPRRLIRSVGRPRLVGVPASCIDRQDQLVY